MKLFNKTPSNLLIFTIVDSFWKLGWGLIGPLYAIFIKDIGGGIEIAGVALAIVLYVTSILSILIGKVSDKIGRKPLLILTGFSYAYVVFLYTTVTTVISLYILQVLLGIVDAMRKTTDVAFIGDITKKERRGFQVGLYRTMTDMAKASAVLLAGFLIGEAGFKIIFYIGSGIIFLSTFLLFEIKEKRLKKWSRINKLGNTID